MVRHIASHAEELTTVPGWSLSSDALVAYLAKMDTPGTPVNYFTTMPALVPDLNRFNLGNCPSKPFMVHEMAQTPSQI